LYEFPGGIGSAGFSKIRTDEIFSVHHAVRIRPCPKNKPAQLAGFLRPGDIRKVCAGTKPISAARLLAGKRAGNGHTPRKLPSKTDAISRFIAYLRLFGHNFTTGALLE
jgi:hypothetical protein